MAATVHRARVLAVVMHRRSPRRTYRVTPRRMSPRSEVISALLVAAVLSAAGGAAFYRFGRSHRVPEPAPAATKSSVVATSAPVSPTDPDPQATAPGPSAAVDLPKDAPKEVRFGVILVQYRGAEQAPGNALTKDAALAKANGLVAEARQSFDEAVKKGDRGSTADAGTMPRGVLEPTLEYALFTLKKGEVYGSPLDTARGFWILRRNE